jgi:hypothetical protein
MNDKLAYPVTSREVTEFHRAAMFLLARIRNDGWKPSSNYLREHVRCASGLKFSNTRSPYILRALLAEHPELGSIIELGPLFREN